MTAIGDIGERELIVRFRKLFARNDTVVTGVGDDCAVVRPGANDINDLVLTSDAVIEGVHFLPAEDGGRIGHKAIARALSDIAAMGATPMWSLVDVVAPTDFDLSRIETIITSAAETAGNYDMMIVGGDTTAGQLLELHVFAVGQLPRGGAVLRSGASPDDSVYVTGALGGSSAGRNMTFEPRVQHGSWLRQGGWATAMIDISDGLSVDIHHLAEASRVGALIHEEALPVSAAAAEKDGDCLPKERALNDGEDYELLFTVSRAKEEALEAAWDTAFDLELSRIGRITSDHGTISLVSADGTKKTLEARGYQHFSRIRM